jgi:hypothetical protein
MSNRPQLEIGSDAARADNRFLTIASEVLNKPPRQSRGKFINGPIPIEQPQNSSGKSLGNGKKPTPAPDDYSEDIRTYLASQSPEDGAKLLEKINPIIERATLANLGKPSPVLAGRARLLAMESLHKYDGRSSLYTFLSGQLQPLKREAATMRVGVKIPRNLVNEQSSLKRAEADLEDHLGRLPSIAELADYTGFPTNKIEELNRMHLPMIAEKETTGSDGDTYTSSDQGVQRDDGLWTQAVYYDLNPSNQIIMEHSLGLFGKPVLSNQEIARKLRITPGAVSQRKAVIQRKLNQP